jgi:regulatory protein
VTFGEQGGGGRRGQWSKRGPAKDREDRGPRVKKTFATTPAHEIEAAVRDKCLSLLSQQPRTRAELERKLVRLEAPPEVIAQVLDRFSDVKLIDDAAFAAAYVRTGVGVRRRGTRSLRSELKMRGVSDDDIESATSEVDEDTERATALALASRRAASFARLAPEVRRRRLMGLLMRRGFSSAIISSVMAEVLASFSADPAELEDADESEFDEESLSR